METSDGGFAGRDGFNTLIRDPNERPPMETSSQDHPSKRCAKCLTPMPNPDWVVNKEMAYCSDCADLLHLGESKESRLFNDPQGQPEGSPRPEAVPVPDDEDSGENQP